MQPTGAVLQYASRTAFSVLLACAAPAVQACGPHSFEANAWREHRVLQDARERDFIAATAAQADVIAIVEVTEGGRRNSDAGDANARFRVVRVLKGKANDAITATWHDARARRAAEQQRRDVAENSVTMFGCWPDDDFDQVNFEYAESYRFLVYLRNGRVLRANPFHQGPSPIDADTETRLIAPQEN